MAVASLMVPLGTPAPGFDLPTVHDGRVTLADLTADVVCVMFLCGHCPYVVHIEDQLTSIVADHPAVAFVGICSNDPDLNAADRPDGLRAQAARAGWAFPYAIDGDSSVGRAYRAACTPDFFVYGPDRTLVYRGGMDGSSPGNGEPHDGAALRDALTLTAAGASVPEPHLPAMGCSIKWAMA